MRLRRSELSTPGTSEKMLAKAAASEADLVFCDLEDSVAPAHKEAARKLVVDAMTTLDWGRKTKAVRINSVETSWWRDDVTEVAGGAEGALDLVIVPKVKSADDVASVTALLDLVGSNAAVEVLIEEAEALVNVEEIAPSDPRLEALIFGPGDFSASQGVRWGLLGQATWEGDIWGYHRSRIIVAARAAGIEAVDGPFANFRNLDGYRAEATNAALIGYAGKWAIHPDQIAIANEVFSPTAEEVASAQQILDGYNEAQAAGEGAAGIGGVMIDAATVRIMQGVLQRADAIRERSS